MEEFSYAGPKSYDIPGKNLVFPKIKIDDMSGKIFAFQKKLRYVRKKFWYIRKKLAISPPTTINIETLVHCAWAPSDVAHSLSFFSVKFLRNFTVL
jgi:hypothetical protein